MITDSESQALTRQSSSSMLGGGFVLGAVGVALVVLWTFSPDMSLLFVLGLVAGVAGALLVAAALVRLAEKFEDLHRMRVAEHQARTRQDIQDLRERS